MARPGKQASAVDREAAEAIAVARAYVPGRGRQRACCAFLSLPDWSRTRCAREPARAELSLAVLEHLAGDESLLLVFAASHASCTRKRQPRHRRCSRGRSNDRAAGKTEAPLRIGIDLGGTKIAGVVLGADGRPLAEHRMRGAAPRLRRDRPRHRPRWCACSRTESAADGRQRSASACPGSVAPASGLVQNANSTWLNGKPFAARPRGAAGPPGPARQRRQLLCPVGGRGWRRRRRAHACSASSSARAAAAGSCATAPSSTVRAASAANGATTRCRGRAPTSIPARKCWCGRVGCIETWVSGPGLEADHARATGERIARRGDRRTRRRAAMRPPGRRSTVTPAALPAGSRMCQHLRSRRDRAGRRPLQAHPPLRGAAGLVAPYVFAEPAHVIVKPPVLGRRRRRARGRVAVGT